MTDPRISLYTTLLRQVEAFTEASGVDPREPWSPEMGNIGNAVRIVISNGPRRTVRRLRSFNESVIATARANLANLDKLDEEAIASEQNDLFEVER